MRLWRQLLWTVALAAATDRALRRLLDHTSGLKDFYRYLYFRPDREETVALVTKSWTESELLALAARLGFW